jgi:hypothetical protein
MTRLGRLAAVTLLVVFPGCGTGPAPAPPATPANPTATVGPPAAASGWVTLNDAKMSSVSAVPMRNPAGEIDYTIKATNSEFSELVEQVSSTFNRDVKFEPADLGKRGVTIEVTGKSAAEVLQSLAQKLELDLVTPADESGAFVLKARADKT